MKKLSIIMLLLTAGYLGFGQCNKKVTLTSSKTDYLLSDGTLQKTVAEHITIEFDRDSILIAMVRANEPGPRFIRGAVTAYTCNWTRPFKEGKLVLQAIIAEIAHPDKTRHITFTVTGNGEKVSILGEANEKEYIRNIRATADTFEEKK